MNGGVNILTQDFAEDYAHRAGLPVDAVPTPFASVNESCRDDGGGHGLARGWFVVAGGNPGHGKSILALNFAAEALRHGEPVGYGSLEMSRFQLASRFYGIYSGEAVWQLERGRFNRQAWDQAFAKARAAPSEDKPYLAVPDVIYSLAQLLEWMEQEREYRWVRWFVVDYLQLVGVGDDDEINRRVTEVTTHLRAFAMRTGSVVLALSQFNRSTSSNYHESPRPQGLHGGMILEASADLILLLDHSRADRDGDHGRTWLLVAKNRHGPLGEVPIEWDYTTLRVRECIPEEEPHDWPTHDHKSNTTARR